MGGRRRCPWRFFFIAANVDEQSFSARLVVSVVIVVGRFEYLLAESPAYHIRLQFGLMLTAEVSGEVVVVEPVQFAETASV